METTKKIFGRDVFKQSDCAPKNKIAQAGTILGLIEKSTDQYTEIARDVIGKKWLIESTLGQAFALGSYDGCDHLLKRDVFDYAFNRAEDGMLLSDESGNILGAFRIDYKAGMIKNETHSHTHIALLDSEVPGEMLDYIRLRTDTKVLYAIAFTYASAIKTRLV